MLAANTYALETKAVQTMVTIRNRDFDFMTQRLSAIGTQASLFAGFIMGTFAANTLMGLANWPTINLLYISTVTFQHITFNYH